MATDDGFMKPERVRQENKQTDRQTVTVVSAVRLLNTN